MRLYNSINSVYVGRGGLCHEVCAAIVCPCQVVVPSDLSELLTKDAGIHAASFDLALPSNDAPPSEKLHQFRMLILSGRKKVRPVG